MIRNLNQVTFQGFGTVLPERGKATRPAGKGASLILNLEQTSATVYRARTDTWLSCASGTSVLCVSSDGESFLEFYLDKPVCVKKDV